MTPTAFVLTGSAVAPSRRMALGPERIQVHAQGVETLRLMEKRSWKHDQM